MTYNKWLGGKCHPSYNLTNPHPGVLQRGTDSTMLIPLTSRKTEIGMFSSDKKQGEMTGNVWEIQEKFRKHPENSRNLYELTKKFVYPKKNKRKLWTRLKLNLPSCAHPKKGKNHIPLFFVGCNLAIRSISFWRKLPFLSRFPKRLWNLKRKETRGAWLTSRTPECQHK